MLTLINACFGANAFVLGNTGAAGTPDGPGSFIITAGSPKNEVQALIPSRGSLFFDLIVNGVSSGEADPVSSQYYLANASGEVTQRGGLTLTFALYNYLAGSFFKINAVQKKADPQFLTISPPYLGAVQSGMAQGAFFFLSKGMSPRKLSGISPYLVPLPSGSPVETASVSRILESRQLAISGKNTNDNLVTPPQLSNTSSTIASTPLDESTKLSYIEEPTSLPLGPISSLKGRPDIKIFKPPAIYPIKGYDFSSADGKINWTKFANHPKPNFIYARALGWAGRDNTFTDRWSHARVLNIDRGAYIKFNFCQSVELQLQQLVLVAPPEADALPVGIELVTPTVDQVRGADQLACYNRIGRAQARDQIMALADAINKRWHKTPILMGNSFNLSVLTDVRADRYMIWLNAYGPQSSIENRLKLRGSNPWTIWQYSGTLNVPGVGNKTTGEVFFGTPTQYDAFRRAEGNVALGAVQ